MNVGQLREMLDEFGDHVPVVIEDDDTAEYRPVTTVGGLQLDDYSVVLSAE